jgi:hypothetical protein
LRATQDPPATALARRPVLPAPAHRPSVEGTRPPSRSTPTRRWVPFVGPFPIPSPLPQAPEGRSGTSRERSAPMGDFLQRRWLAPGRLVRPRGRHAGRRPIRPVHPLALPATFRLPPAQA